MGFVLISYSCENQRKADSFVSFLSGNEIETRLIPGDVPAGNNYFKEMNTAAEECACLVVLLSKAVQFAPWTAMMIKKATDCGKTVIPVQTEYMQINEEFDGLFENCRIFNICNINAQTDEIKDFTDRVKKYTCQEEVRASEEDEPQYPEIPVEYLKYGIEDGGAVITGCDKTKIIGNVKIPKKINDYPVTSIFYKAFYGCENLISISLPDSVKTIGLFAFADCENLISITIPEGVTEISYHAFTACTSLTSISLPDSVKTIGDGAFADCENLRSIKIPDGMTIIENNVFCFCKNLASITIPDRVTEIGFHAFLGCRSFTSISLPSSLTKIDIEAFNFCENITTIEIPGSVKSIGYNAFSPYTTLIVEKGSYAEKWAKDNGKKYKYNE